MGSATKLLRPYQARLVADVSRADGHVLVEQPTGSGKTIEIVTLVGMHLGRRFSHAVIAAPQEQIEHGFVHRDYRSVAWPKVEGAGAAEIVVPAELIWGARQSQLGSVRRLLAYLRQPAPADHALACTHAALNRLTPDKLPADLAGKALFLDEAHHASADGLSQLVTLWRERGGQVFFFTATPYRGDGRPVRLDGMRAFRRSLAEHMAEKYAPQHLDSEIVALGQPGDAITAGQFTGEEAPPSSYFEGLVAAICRRWREDGKPKAIIRVPPMHGGRSGKLVSRLVQALSAQGARVLDATGTGAADKQRFLTALDAEKNRTHATSAFDVLVGIQRVLEGTDWPVCSAVYCVGMPGSLNTVVQFLGRAMRLKGADYPAAQRDRARLVFFVPCGGGAALADLSIDHSRHALLTCCFLADHEVGQEWIVLREVRRGIEAALGPRTDNPAAADAENEADEPLDPEVRAEVELALAGAREQIISNGGEPTLGEVVQLTARARPDLPATALHRVAAEILAAQPGSTGATARDMIHQEVSKRLRIDPLVKQAMAEAFAVALDEFRAVTLKDSVMLESVGRQVHGVTGGQMREFAQRLRDAAPRPLTEEEILGWADAFHERTGDWPQHKSGLIVEAPDDSWRNIDNAFRLGLRGLPGGSSLALLLEEKRGVRNVQNLDGLSEGLILQWADAHWAKSHAWPRKTSGPVADAPGETWANIDAALYRGGRGLQGKSSLARLLREKRGVINIQDLPDLTEQQVLQWADAHHGRTKKWPNVTSGPVVGAADLSWRQIDGALRHGSRGFAGGSSLALLLAEHRQARNPAGLPVLTTEQILVWADSHYARTGKWPRQKSGAIPEAPGETWAGIDYALAHGSRGLSGDSTLAQLLEEHRGVRNQSNLATLTKEQILAWADAHYERTSEWPDRQTGAIPDIPPETWRRIDNALRYGLRGLPGSSSLAKLLAEMRLRPNRANLAPLTEEMILAWARVYFKRTGKWPNVASGAVDNALGEKWANIDASLREGRRGLQGGSSLARLIKQHREGA